jgi:hypothetical protein
MGADLLRIFVGRRIQPLRRREMTMWMYPGLGCLDHSFSAELNNVEINGRIQGILVHGAGQDPGPYPAPLREGVVSP